MLYRIDYMQRVVREGRGQRKLDLTPSEYMRRNVYITSSGMAWEPAIRFAQNILGVDRVLYAMDYPYQADPAEVRALDAMELSPTDKRAFFEENAVSLFGL
jgi:2,3-dihydroxybenzoate decarboxylase